MEPLLSPVRFTALTPPTPTYPPNEIIIFSTLFRILKKGNLRL